MDALPLGVRVLQGEGVWERVPEPVWQAVPLGDVLAVPVTVRDTDALTLTLLVPLTLPVMVGLPLGEREALVE